MADIGVTPTKDTIRITSSTGDHGTITAASPSQAGCMSAAQARQLADLAQRVEGGAIAPIQLLPPAPRVAAPVDAVTRAEMRDALEQMRGVVLQDVSTVLNAIREEIPQSVASIDAGRFTQIELAIAHLADRVTGLECSMAKLDDAFSSVLQEKAA